MTPIPSSIWVSISVFLVMSALVLHVVHGVYEHHRVHFIHHLTFSMHQQINRYQPTIATGNEGHVPSCTLCNEITLYIRGMLLGAAAAPLGDPSDRLCKSKCFFPGRKSLLFSNQISEVVVGVQYNHFPVALQSHLDEWYLCSMSQALTDNCSMPPLSSTQNSTILKKDN